MIRSQLDKDFGGSKKKKGETCEQNMRLVIA